MKLSKLITSISYDVLSNASKLRRMESDFRVSLVMQKWGLHKFARSQQVSWSLGTPLYSSSLRST